jgi:hypothetical protein
MDVLATLMEKARQEEATKQEEALLATGHE